MGNANYPTAGPLRQEYGAAEEPIFTRVCARWTSGGGIVRESACSGPRDIRDGLNRGLDFGGGRIARQAKANTPRRDS